MVLVDTSVWVSHLRHGDRNLEGLLSSSKVLCHPFVIGELACENIKKRREILSLLQNLPQAASVSREEFLHFIEFHKLFAVGIGFVDVHLLASACVSETPLWTDDQKLCKAAKKLKIAYV